MPGGALRRRGAAAGPRAPLEPPLDPLGGGAVDIVPARDEEVWGALYEVADGALDRLDAKEGEGRAYRRVCVRVEHDGRWVTAAAYEVIDKEPGEVPPTPEYAALLAEGARERGLPDH